MSDPTDPKFSPVPISVSESDKTPITHQPISKVDGQNWSTMSISQLHSELATMRSRLQTLIQMEKNQPAQQLQNGIAMLEMLITERYNKTETFI